MTERNFNVAVTALDQVVRLSRAMGLAVRGEYMSLAPETLSALVAVADIATEHAEFAFREVSALAQADMRERMAARKGL